MEGSETPAGGAAEVDEERWEKESELSSGGDFIQNILWTQNCMQVKKQQLEPDM